MITPFVKRYTLLFVLILAFVLGVFRIWEDRVFFTDELLIEDASYTMAKGGSWIVPTVNGFPDLAKPVLVYWVTAPLYFLFSVAPWVRRIPTLLFGILLAATTFKLAENFFNNKKITILSSLFLITSGIYIYFTKAANFDLTNAFFTASTILFYNLGKKEEKYLYLAGLAFSLGILTRSFLALTPAAVIVFDYLLYPKERVAKRKLIIGLTISLLVIIPWHVLAYKSAPTSFIERYLKLPILYHALGRIEGEAAAGPLFYLKTLILFPASVFSVGYLIVNLKESLNSKKAQLIIWALIYVLILAVSSSKHEWYLLPLISPLSILAAAFVYRIERLRGRKILKIILRAFSLVIFLGPPSYLLTNSLPQSDTYAAVRIMQKESLPVDTLYLWEDYELIPRTRFFPGRSTAKLQRKSVHEEVVRKEKIFVLLKRRDKFDIPEVGEETVLYEGNEDILIKITSAKRQK